MQELLDRADQFERDPAAWLREAALYLDGLLLQTGNSIYRRRPIVRGFISKISKVRGANSVISQESLQTEVAQYLDEVVTQYININLDDLINDYEFHSTYDHPVADIPNKFLDKDLDYDLFYDGLWFSIISALEYRLRREGLKEAEAAQTARAVTENFRASATLQGSLDFGQITLLVDMALASLRASHFLTREPETAMPLELPPQAPSLWEDKDSRLPGESPIAYLGRVWEPWMRAGVLYQDDLRKRDEKLITAIRNYCRKRGQDASTFLPPPRKMRIEHGLAKADPNSAEAEFYRHRLRTRQSSTETRRRQRAQAPKPAHG